MSSKSFVSLIMEFFCVLVFLVLLIYSTDRANGRCERILDLQHATVNYRARGYVRIRCDRGYSPQGVIIKACDQSGLLRGEKPFCAKRGCGELDIPEHGHIEKNPLKAEIMCFEGYVLVGSRTAFCDGFRWSTQLGFCRRSNHTGDHSCDFESEDQCGWEAESHYRQPWRRVSAMSEFHSVNTGPHHDHTFGSRSGGHYMRMESQLGAFGSYHLMSPIYPRELSLKTACCFRFHYFMYGSGVESLVVSVKPVSMTMIDMWNRFRANSSKFEMTGPQGTRWLEHTITIDEMQEDFQVIFSATDARSKFGDIAIDDVKLMTGSDCGVNGFTTTTEPPPPTITSGEERFVFDMLNCTGRCGSPDPGVQITENGFVMGCGCDEGCLSESTCCLNYLDECQKDMDTMPFDDLSSPAPQTTPTTTTTTTKKPDTTTAKTTTTTTTTKRTTTSTTTTTPKPRTSTKSTTTTTTTKTPTTRRTSTTTTSTTPKLTTKSSTTPRTTTTAKVFTTKTTKAITTTQKTTAATKKYMTTTTKITTTTPPTLSTPKIAVIGTTEKTRKRITWKVDPKEIAGHMDTSDSSPNPALIVLYMLVGLVLVIVLANVAQRWIIPLSRARSTTEKAVSFKKAFQSLRKHRRRNSITEPLCDTDNEDGDYFEETGVDIRNRTDL
ncbi:uncharacterized protein LOC119548123 [Drosophila subpulchrella]|uniref:uncharacterized protein LOC119548123 n=1 Tax=Drosophila subpulchrella TaxID=1486046 RepID=UPI0018A1ADF5|nr:uncharacterized protein LOC119548123 [Drosophila subpulchrella]